MPKYHSMGALEFWLGPAGSGKTRQALSFLQTLLVDDWTSARYIVPTVGHKRSIEHRFLNETPLQGLFGDPINIFFTFSEEVAKLGGVTGSRLSELQKFVLLKKIIHRAELSYFTLAARFPGFTSALREIIDELKVHMVFPVDLLAAATKAREQGAETFAQKLYELGLLYDSYQQQLIENNLFDSEGIMWLAAECLEKQPLILGNLQYLIFDGFSRLTPIQLHFLRVLSTRLTRVILLFDYEIDRQSAYHPVQQSLDLLQQQAAVDRIVVTEKFFEKNVKATALSSLTSALFRERPQHIPLDTTVQCLQAATPGHEAEMIARNIRRLLSQGTLPNGVPISVDDIAIIARDATQVTERFLHVFQRYDLPLYRQKTLLAHTAPGRALLAVFRLLRDRWQREDVLSLVKGGFLQLDPAIAFQIDAIARTRHLRDQQATWGEEWPDDATRDILIQALQPVMALNEKYHQQHISCAALIEAIIQLHTVFRNNKLTRVIPLPDQNSLAAQQYTMLLASYNAVTTLLEDLLHLDTVVQYGNRDDILDTISSALLRGELPIPAEPLPGIRILSAQTTGGEKFKVLYLCNLLQGAFPKHQRESAFLLDYEREETLPALRILVESRKHLEDDEQFWFIHTLSSVTQQIIFSYSLHDMEGKPREVSSFFDEILRYMPDLPGAAQVTTFRDFVPSLHNAESKYEYLASLVYSIRNERDLIQQQHITVAYAGCPWTIGPSSFLASLFQHARQQAPSLSSPSIMQQLRAPSHLFSASELQSYDDCPFLWFASYLLHITPLVEEFNALDRGAILHSVLENLYRQHQQHYGAIVSFAAESFEGLWQELSDALHNKLWSEPRFRNRPSFLCDIEEEALRRMLKRFLRSEVDRARTRKAHPAFFEESFGTRQRQPLVIDQAELSIRGTIDRIDLCDDLPSHAVVIDYKSATQMTLRDLHIGKIFQAPIYALALAQLFGLSPIGAEFLNLKRGDIRGIYHAAIKDIYQESQGMRVLDDDEWQQFLSQCQLRMQQVVAQLREGNISSCPTTQRCSDACEYFVLCRGDRFQLARLLRNNQP